MHYIQQKSAPVQNSSVFKSLAHTDGHRTMSTMTVCRLPLMQTGTAIEMSAERWGRVPLEGVELSVVVLLHRL